MSYRKYAPLFGLALLASVIAPGLGTIDRSIAPPAIAQSSPGAVFPVPASVPADTQIGIDGSYSMKHITQTIGEEFQKAYPGTKVTAQYDGSLAALKAVEEGKLDLAAIGRNLTEAEKARGLKEVTVARHKIALITSPENPFAGSLTIDQFADIFHGKLKDWSKVGGPAGAIVFVDRPETSDTRSSFENYPVFQKEPFKAGPDTVTVPADTIEAVTEKLGKTGIGYAIVDRVVNNPQVKVLQMHKTLPSDPRYPFSQALTYVYKGPSPSKAVQAFLGFATSPDRQAAIEAARQADAADVATTEPAASPEVAASPEATASPEVTAAPAEESKGGIPGWLWWLLPLAALLLLPFLLKGGEAEPVAEPVLSPVPPIVPPIVPPARKGRIILVPRDCRQAYAYWEVSDEEKTELRRVGGEKLALRVYDVTDIDLDKQPAHDMREYDCRELDPDLHVPIPIDNRDYLAELGYVTPEGSWLKLARSASVRVPACPPATELLTNARETLADVGENVTGGAVAALAGATALAAGAAAAVQGLVHRDRPETDAPVDYFGGEDGTSRIVLVPRNCQEAYAYWELTDADKAIPAGDRLVLRVYDVTDIDLDLHSAHDVQQYDVPELASDLHVPIATDNRDYLAEIGTLTPSGYWSPKARSKHVRVPACPPGAGLFDNARENLSNVTENLSERATSTWDILNEPVDVPGAGLFDNARENLSNVTENLSERATSTWDILNEPVDVPGAGLFDNARENLSNVTENLSERATNIWETFSEPVDIPGAGLWDNARENLSNVTQNLAEPATSAKETLADLGGNLAGGAAAAFAGVAALGTGAAAAASSWWSDRSAEEPVIPAEGIVYVPRDSQEAHIYWEVSAAEKEAIRLQGGTKLALRVYDLTDSNDDGNPDSVWEYEVEEFDRELSVPIHRHDRDYSAELGYRTEEGRWLPIVRSNPVYVPLPPEPTEV